MYHVKFFGGPRDGDHAYQVISPPENYDIPVHININTPEFLGVPVTINEPLVGGIEAHHYELVWVDTRLGVFAYRGVKLF